MDELRKQHRPSLKRYQKMKIKYFSLSAFKFYYMPLTYPALRNTSNQYVYHGTFCLIIGKKLRFIDSTSWIKKRHDLHCKKLKFLKADLETFFFSFLFYYFKIFSDYLAPFLWTHLQHNDLIGILQMSSGWQFASQITAIKLQLKLNLKSLPNLRLLQHD